MADTLGGKMKKNITVYSTVRLKSGGYCPNEKIGIVQADPSEKWDIARAMMPDAKEVGISGQLTMVSNGDNVLFGIMSMDRYSNDRGISIEGSPWCNFIAVTCYDNIVSKHRCKSYDGYLRSLRKLLRKYNILEHSAD